MIIILSVLLSITMISLALAIIRIRKIEDMLIEVDKEQHTQNMDIMEILKTNNEQDKTILYIIEYLVDKEKKVVFPYTGPMGEA